MDPRKKFIRADIELRIIIISLINRWWIDNIDQVQEQAVEG